MLFLFFNHSKHSPMGLSPTGNDHSMSQMMTLTTYGAFSMLMDSSILFFLSFPFREQKKGKRNRLMYRLDSTYF